jgi:hypothetical protein
MRISTRARVAFLLSIATLLVVALAGSQLAAAGPESRDAADGGGSSGVSVGGSGPASGGGTAGMCAAPAPGEAGVAGCDDTLDEPMAPPHCGEQVNGSGPDAVVSYTPCPGDDQPAPGDGAQLVEPTPGMTDVRPHAFDHAVVGDDGTSVTVYFWSGVEPCYVLDHVDVAYGADAVTITLYEGHDASAGDAACIDIAVSKKVVVQLDQPLGDREIVDGAA